MTYFCLLWVPLFYLFRRSLAGGGGTSGSVWALLLGCITAIIQYLLGYIFTPGGFGFSRWLFGFFEVVSMPVILPYIAFFVMYMFGGFSSDIDFSDFTLLWLIPVGALKALTWSSLNDPILLVMTPLLWTALAVGISFLIQWVTNSYNTLITALAIFCMVLLPIVATAAYWAFFSQHLLPGFILLAAAHVPFGFSFAHSS
jgi:hypothetical protein